MTQAAEPTKPRPFWERRTREGMPEGADLAALRRGFGRPPGTVPQMWAYYTTLSSDGSVTASLRAEHIALCLFGLHQQSQASPMHAPRISLGAACASLRDSGRYSEQAVDRRFTAMATATSLDEVAWHLRGLVAQLRTIPQPLDYTLLASDLRRWQAPGGAADVRRRWGSAYFVSAPRS